MKIYLNPTVPIGGTHLVAPSVRLPIYLAYRGVE